MSQATVLYVEDEPDDVLFMRIAFQKTGAPHGLHAVTDGPEAIAYLSGTGQYSDRSRYPVPTVVLMDVNLPLLSGFEVLEWLRQQPRWKELPVVIFSSSGRPEDRKKAEALGANDYLLKPISGFDFPEIVRQVQQQWLKAG